VWQSVKDSHTFFLPKSFNDGGSLNDEAFYTLFTPQKGGYLSLFTPFLHPVKLLVLIICFITGFYKNSTIPTPGTNDENKRSKKH
jgi:hypothetical protein